ncbi:DUF5320 domain-containing protein [bacterium]|nr:DUF5320 domain-containing protein [bacterium]
MPFGNGTGPLGQGPMTGRGAGYCAGYGTPGYMNPTGGRYGRGYFGWGRGWGWRNWSKGAGFGRRWGGFGAWGGYPSTLPQPTASEEKEILTQQMKSLEEELKGIKARLQEISKDSKKNSSR